MNHRKLQRITFAVLAVLAAAVGSLAGLTLVYSIDLPEIAELQSYRPPAVTELFDRHGTPFGSFALQRRIAVSYDAFAPILREAVIAIEDKNFESHGGVNMFRVLGAAYHDLRSSGRAQGASTLTMQLARNLFLSDRRTLGRKLQEILLSIQIERAFTKSQIFTLYANQIYLGHGVYGFEAGAEYFFSKHAAELTLPEAALLAGLPKGPSEFSPISNPDRCMRRRNQVINALLEDGRITNTEAAEARETPLGLRIQPPPNSEAPWFVEAVRRELEETLGREDALAGGLRVYTTLDLALEQRANAALLAGLAAYERRRGWQGHLLNVLAAHLDPDTFRHPDWAPYESKSAAMPPPGTYVHALVTGVLPFQVSARMGSSLVVLDQDSWAWTGFRTAPEFLRTGDLIYVRTSSAGSGPVLHATLEQDSGAQGALLALDNVSGDVLAMVGGRDFNLSQFNRATEAVRQVGSSFKPYVYTAAIEAGASPEQTILDTPASFGGYTPHDYEGNTLGSITLLKAFAESRNIPAVRLADRVGMAKVAEVAHRFGVTTPIPPYLPVALGAVEISLVQQVSAYSVFPNDGVRVPPRLVTRVTTSDGVPVSLAVPPVTPVISQHTARTMTRMLEEVTRTGTAAGAADLLAHPVGGKTGTTQNFTDAWFLGFSPSVTAGVWVGFDNRTPLGKDETGAKAALPIWVNWMQAAVAEHPEERFPGTPR